MVSLPRGLGRRSVQPASRAASRSSGEERAVQATMGTSHSPAIWLIERVAAGPAGPAAVLQRKGNCPVTKPPPRGYVMSPFIRSEREERS